MIFSGNDSSCGESEFCEAFFRIFTHLFFYFLKKTSFPAYHSDNESRFKKLALFFYFPVSVAGASFV